MAVGQRNTDRLAGLATGQRIRIKREARGMSRPVLAGLVGRSSDWLKKIENGDRPLNSLSLLIELARTLDVRDLSELTGDDFKAPVRGVWRLPRLIRQAHSAIRSTDGDARRRCRSATADLYRLVQRLLAHICEPELHALAVERGLALSEEADTPMSSAQATWSSAVGLCAAGHYDLAAQLADHGATAILRSCGDDLTPAAMGTLGALQLEAAAAHGLAGREGDAYRYLDAAAHTAARMPSGAWHLPSAFDRTNVEILAVIVGVSLHRYGEAVGRAHKIDLSSTPSVVRRSRLLLECANGHANRREFVDAVRTLGAATQISLEAVALIPWAQTLANELAERAPRTVRADAQRLRSTLTALI